MIVRRFDRATGREVAPVSIKQAAWAIARALSTEPTRRAVEIIEIDLQWGYRQQTAGYLYVPDADPPTDDEDAGAMTSGGEGAATKAA